MSPPVVVRGRPGRRARSGVLVCTGTLLLVSALGWGAGLRLNLSGSMPIGLYRLSTEPAARRAIVLACLPTEVAIFARSRRYVPHGPCPGGTAPIGKVVLALGGDVVQVTGTGLVVNGQAVRGTTPLAVDGAGRSLRRFPNGAYRVRADEVWLYSPYSARSFDSRYFGPVPRSCILSRVLPLWTVE
jgi:conjugative transfer signal peptidase TraF